MRLSLRATLDSIHVVHMLATVMIVPIRVIQELTSVESIYFATIKRLHERYLTVYWFNAEYQGLGSLLQASKQQILVS